jgi:hypothetical protein
MQLEYLYRKGLSSYFARSLEGGRWATGELLGGPTRWMADGDIFIIHGVFAEEVGDGEPSLGRECHLRV